MDGQVEVTWRTLKNIKHSIMAHARVYDEYIHFSLICTTDHIFPNIPNKKLVNQDGEPTRPHTLENGTKTSVSNLRVLLCPYVVLKATAHVYTKVLTMRHQSQKGSCGIFVGIPHNQKSYLIYVPSTRKIVSSHDVVLDKTFNIALAYTSCIYSESLAMRPAVLYIPYATSSHEQTGDIITFAQFE